MLLFDWLRALNQTCFLNFRKYLGLLMLDKRKASHGVNSNQTNTKRLLLNKVNHRNQLEHDNEQFQSVKGTSVGPSKCYTWRRHEIILKLPFDNNIVS